jgi:hypothetical protein
MASKVIGKGTTIKKAAKRGDLFHDSRPLNLVMMTADPRMTKAVEELYEEMEFKGQVKLVKNCLRVLLANLARVQRYSPSTWIRVSADSNKWTDLAEVSHHNPLGISFKFVEVVKVLAKAGYLDYRKGFYQRNTGKDANRHSVLSRIGPTDHMRDFMHQHCLPELVYTPDVKTPLLRLKGAKSANYLTGKPLPLDPKRIPKSVKQANDFLQKYNAFISQQSLGFEQGKKVDGLFLDETLVYRVFNRSSYASLGRLYGGWWMLCSKELRPFININDQSTCELDYHALHPHLLYAEAGVSAPVGDMYAIAGLDRALVKKTMLTMLNADSVGEAYKGLRSELNKSGKSITAFGGYEDDDTTEELEPWQYLQEHLATLSAFKAHLVQPILTKHQAIASSFMADKGTHLQYLDSFVCLRVLEAMTQQNIPCLSVHDSFIVPSQHEASLRLAMEESYKSILNINNLTGSCPSITNGTALGKGP